MKEEVLRKYRTGLLIPVINLRVERKVTRNRRVSRTVVLQSDVLPERGVSGSCGSERPRLGGPGWGVGAPEWILTGSFGRSSSLSEVPVPESDPPLRTVFPYSVSTPCRGFRRPYGFRVLSCVTLNTDFTFCKKEGG